MFVMRRLYLNKYVETLFLFSFIYLFIYLFNFANKHLQREHTKTYMDIWQETRYSFAIYSGPYRKIRQTVNSDIRYIDLN